MADWDVVIIGAGPAGVSAALMAHSVGLLVALFDASSICAQLNHIPKLTNLFGLPLCGKEIAQTAELQVRNAEIRHIQLTVRDLAYTGTAWNISLEDGAVHTAGAVILASGTRPMRLSESTWIAGATDIDCRPLHLTPLATLRSSPIAVIGCDRIFWTWAEQFMSRFKHLNFILLAFPDKWHLEDCLDNMDNVLFVKCQRIESIKSNVTFSEIIYENVAGESIDVKVAHLTTILGNVPNLDLVRSFASLSIGGFLTSESVAELSTKGFYVVGDAAHREAQRIAVALGDGARAALECFYKVKGLYGR
jgi:thioredoxin reductase